jgi:hypothetical protein
MEGSRRQEKRMSKTSEAGTLTSQSTSIRSRQVRGDMPLSGKIQEPKERKSQNVKPQSKSREGVNIDKDFPYVSQVIPKSNLCNNLVWVESFLDQLLRNPGDENRPVAIPPSENDRAHDHNKGMCPYWEMPKYRFRLPLIKFKKILLQS